MIRNQNLSLKLFTKIGSLSIYLKNYFKFFLSTLKFGLYEIFFIAYVQLPIVVVGFFYGFEEVASVALAITVINIFLMPSAVFQKIYIHSLFLGYGGYDISYPDLGGIVPKIGSAIVPNKFETVCISAW